MNVGQLLGELKKIEMPSVLFGKQNNDRRYGSTIYLDSLLEQNPNQPTNRSSWRNTSASQFAYYQDNHGGAANKSNNHDLDDVLQSKRENQRTRGNSTLKQRDSPDQTQIILYC